MRYWRPEPIMFPSKCLYCGPLRKIPNPNTCFGDIAGLPVLASPISSDQFPLPLTTMARTRQTARKTTGGQVPRKEVIRRDRSVVESNASSSVVVCRAPVHQVSKSGQFVSVAYPMTTGFLLRMH